MRGSWRLGRFAGIDAYVHWTFGLLLAWAAWASWSGAGSGVAVILGVGFLLAVFASVLLHELGHALTARVFGVRTQHILLTPLGGIASLEGMPRAPRAELAVALAGPAVNFAIAAAIALAMQVTGASMYGLLDGLLWANLSLGLFNLLPAFPMDGGRALRAWLSARKGRQSATRTAVKIGRVLAVAMAIAGVFYNPMLIAIAAFVWFAGKAEARATESAWGDDAWWSQTRRASPRTFSPYDDARWATRVIYVGRRPFFR
jgi:Zn-dependent protease